MAWGPLCMQPPLPSPRILLLWAGDRCLWPCTRRGVRSPRADWLGGAALRPLWGLCLHPGRPSIHPHCRFLMPWSLAGAAPSPWTHYGPDYRIGAMWWCASWDWSCSGFALWTHPASPRCKNMWRDMQRLWHWGGFWGQAGFKWQIWNLRCMGNAFFSSRCWVSVFWPHAAWYPSPFFWGPMGDHVGYARPTHHSCSPRLSFLSMPWPGAQWTLIVEPVLPVPSLAWAHLFHCRNSATWGGQHHRTPTFLPPMHGASYPWPSRAQRRWSWTCLQILRLVGAHSQSRSLARQCRRRCEGMGMRCCGYGAGPLFVAVMAGGMGSCCGLALTTFLCLAAGIWVLWASSSSLRLHTKWPIAISLARFPSSNINEERLDLVRDDDGVKQEGTGGVKSLWGAVCWVFCTWDVSHVDLSITIL